MGKSSVERLTRGASRIKERRVIALPDSERLAGFLSQAAAERFVIHEATDNRQGRESRRFDAVAFMEHFSRAPLPAEIGCTLSHLDVLRQFGEAPGCAGDLVLVAEDDARFVHSFEQALSAIEPHVPESALVVLADPYGPGGVRDRSLESRSEYFVQLSLLATRLGQSAGIKGLQIGRWSAGLTGTGAYLATRCAAQRITRFVADQCDGLPWWMADYHGVYRDHIGIDVLAVRPNLADWEGDSSIQDESHVAWRLGEHVGPKGQARWPLLAKEGARRFKMQIKSTKFDVEWRLRHRK